MSVERSPKFARIIEEAGKKALIETLCESNVSDDDKTLRLMVRLTVAGGKDLKVVPASVSGTPD